MTISENIPPTPVNVDYTAADDYAPADVEHQFHHYTGNRIPWYIRVLWVLFWIFAIYYTLSYLFPALRMELISPP